MPGARSLLVTLAVGSASCLGAGAAFAGGVVGTGVPGSCTDAAFGAALVGGGLVTFDCGFSGPLAISTHVIPSGDVTIIEGSSVSLSGEGLNRHFVVEPGASLTLRLMEVMFGASSQGGAILNRGTLVIEESLITSNTATSGGQGGAIYNDVGADLTIVRSNLSFNQSTGQGGALFNQGTATLSGVDLIDGTAVGEGAGLVNAGGSLTIDLSRVGGFSDTRGGGIHQSGGVLDIRRTMLSGNAILEGGALHQLAGSATFENVAFQNGQAPRGGSVSAHGSVELRNTTFFQNQGDEGGSLFVGPSGAVSAVNTLFSETLDFLGQPGLHCAGSPLSSLGHNLSSDASCNLVAAGDLPSTDPLIAAEVAGPWGVIFAPALGSPAIDAGDDSVCPATDQRNSMSRPQDGGSGFAICDIGAIEVVPEPGWSALLAGGLALAMVGRRKCG